MPLNVSVGVDYMLSPTDLTFPAGSQQGSQQCVTVAITDDVSVENKETFNLQLSTTDANVRIALCDRSSVVINDNDSEYQL